MNIINRYPTSFPTKQKKAASYNTGHVPELEEKGLVGASFNCFTVAAVSFCISLFCIPVVRIVLGAMLAMCVGKTADSTAPTTGAFHHQTVSNQKARWMKNNPSGGPGRVVPQTTNKSSRLEDRFKDKDPKERTVVRDDEEGHLIYKPGDILDSRCN